MRFMTLCAVVAMTAFASAFCEAQDPLERARARTNDLRYEVYATSGQVEQLATDPAALARAWGVIRKMGITKVYTEVYRSGHLASDAHLIFVRDWLREKGIDVTGGIATVPGGNFGVPQKAPLDWFNWQNNKTQRDVREVIRSKADIFDTFIVDDFFCTGDLSEESATAKGDRSWGEYRRGLLSELARSVIVGPAKEVNPAITMIVKYPQWYDRFHLFGYDTATLPRIFDQVWVGTETRGRTTQRYGFVQPYEGFVNYRWLAGIAQCKIGGAWFDHGDCGPHDFLDQAYMSVLAGARELVFFNLGDLLNGHPDHARVVDEFDRLADLAAAVRANPITGVPAYKPPNSDPAGDMFVMDFLGMMGIPIIPVHEFPETAPVIFLPAQAAADPHLVTHVEKACARGAQIIMTTSLLTVSPDASRLARMAGLGQQVQSRPLRAQLTTPSTEKRQRAKHEVTVDLESPLEIDPGPGGIAVTAGDKRYALLASAARPGSRVALLNTHTFSQSDFDAVGEVLLCPRPLGLLAIEGSPLRALRAAFRSDTGAVFEGPNCVACQPFGGRDTGSCVIQNYNETPANVTLTLQLPAGESARYVDAFTGNAVSCRASDSGTRTVLDLVIPARGRTWIRPADDTPQEISIPSSIDGVGQPVLFFVPPGAEPDAKGAHVPLVVSLHTWSTGYRSYDAYKPTLAGCRERGWAFLSPQFRGPNVRPEACASDLAVQDVLDALDYALTHARIDADRVYVLGGSGGGHMALVMSHRAPDRWAAVSAWVPVTDLEAWHRYCDARGYVYAKRIERCLAGPPGERERDRQYRERSPIHWLSRAKGVPIDIQAGIHDGHGGAAIPIDHSLRAFNVLAEANGCQKAMLSTEDISFLTREARVPDHLAGQREDEPGRKHRVLFRRTTGPVRLTLFDGGHAIDAGPALTWLAEHTNADARRP